MATGHNILMSFPDPIGGTDVCVKLYRCSCGQKTTIGPTCLDCTYRHGGQLQDRDEQHVDDMVDTLRKRETAWRNAFPQRMPR